MPSYNKNLTFSKKEKHLSVEYYLDECPYCHNKIVFYELWFYEGGWRKDKDTSKFYCPFCESFICRHGHGSNVMPLSDHYALIFLFKTKEKKEKIELTKEEVEEIKKDYEVRTANRYVELIEL